MWEHCLEHAALSDVGLRRANNQDSLSVVLAGNQRMWQERGHLFVVADGMGAHAAGELASKLAVDTISLTYSKLREMSSVEAIRTALREANDTIHGRGQADPEFQGMGTTATSLLLLPQGAVAAHVGDSRAYRLRGKRYEQLTFDHSLVWELRAAGDLGEEDIPSYVPKNIITRSLGPSPKVQIDLEGPFPLQVGDTFLLCSDGLSGPVTDEEMAMILAVMPPDEAVRTLVDLANLRGGPDNITVIVARVTGPQVAQDDGPEEKSAAAKPGVPPLIWPLLGAFAMALVGAVAMQHWPAAVICLIGVVGAGVAATVLSHRKIEPPSDFDGRPLGKAPYTSVSVTPNGEFAARISAIVEKLRDSAIRADWTVDWHRFRELLEAAAKAEQTADYGRATRDYFRALSFMMTQLKQQPDDDSGVLDQ